eukprot:TRINITY_DN6895_c0_g1_i2.p1 TRINITY_DN6895_c0_g1~~TRINITY_DN6895_c0_g1_i2.p1  ORF type:complete len:239 (+),score=46.37 TRINITY_DN6895_c0_g1_i2:45-761(+)
MARDSSTGFYDGLAADYDLVYADWAGSSARQSRVIAEIAAERWGLVPGSARVLDVACGIGTQALGLAALGFAVRGSDLSTAEVARAKDEARRRGTEGVEWCVGDMREAAALHGEGAYDLAIAYDNAIPHLPTLGDMRRVLQEMRRCLKPGGGCLVSVRDYVPVLAQQQQSAPALQPYGVRKRSDGSEVALFQVRPISFFAVDAKHSAPWPSSKPCAFPSCTPGVAVSARARRDQGGPH